MYAQSYPSKLVHREDFQVTTVATSMHAEWKQKCNERFRLRVKDALSEFEEVSIMYTTASQEVPFPVAFPTGLDVHWETEKRVVWNERERATEEQELIYEVSWICELGFWRRFLKSRRKVQN